MLIPDRFNNSSPCSYTVADPMETVHREPSAARKAKDAPGCLSKKIAIKIPLSYNSKGGKLPWLSYP